MIKGFFLIWKIKVIRLHVKTSLLSNTTKMNISVERGVMVRRRQLPQKKYILAMLIRFIKMEIININAKLVFST